MLHWDTTAGVTVVREVADGFELRIEFAGSFVLVYCGLLEGLATAILAVRLACCIFGMANVLTKPGPRHGSV